VCVCVKKYTFKDCMAMNETIKSHSQRTLVTFVAVPPSMLSSTDHVAEIQQAFEERRVPRMIASAFRAMDVLSYGLPAPTAFVVPSNQRFLQLSLKD
jgi:hypothetical protein